MPRYIDADEAKRKATDPYVRIFLDNQPTADVEPVVHARWLRRVRNYCNYWEDLQEYPVLCSACYKKSKEESKRCHECGARMDEKEK